MSPELSDFLTILLDPFGKRDSDGVGFSEAFVAYLRKAGVQFCNYGTFEADSRWQVGDPIGIRNLRKYRLEESGDADAGKACEALPGNAIPASVQPFDSAAFCAWLGKHLTDGELLSADAAPDAIDETAFRAFAVIGRSPSAADSAIALFFGFSFGGARDRMRCLSESSNELGIAFFALIGRLRRTKNDGLEQFPDTLTAREKEVLAAHSAGLRRDGIGYRLGIALPTVDLHTRRLREKLQAHTIPEAVAKGYRYGIL